MSHRPAISVIMPVYNTAQFLREAIDSIINQTFTDFEFIIIDDASTDGSKEISKTYTDHRIILIENEINKGYVYGLNYAISIARGKYVARMDSDDISSLARLQVQYDFLENSKNVVMCGTFYELIGSRQIVELPVCYEDVKNQILYENAFGHPTVMFSREFFHEHNLNYDSFMVPAEDFNLWSRIAEIGEIRNIPQVLLFYRLHDKQISQTKNLEQLKITHQICWRNLVKYAELNDSLFYEDSNSCLVDEFLSRLIFFYKFIAITKHPNIVRLKNYYLYSFREDLLLEPKFRSLMNYSLLKKEAPQFFYDYLSRKSRLSFYLKCLFLTNE